jgi:3-dehydroquinate dehydratase
MGGRPMAGFLGTKEVLTRERVKEILQNKEYSYLEEKVNLLEVRDDSFLLKISFLIEYHQQMIAIEEKEPIVITFKDFKVEDWGDGIRKLADIE